MANKKNSKPTDRKPSTKKQAENLAEAQLQAMFGETLESAEKIIEENKKTIGLDWEDRYPGIKKQIQRFTQADLPSCPHCGSDNTAKVQVGIVGRIVMIAGVTKKVKLVPNRTDEMGDYFCNKCEKYFD